MSISSMRYLSLLMMNSPVTQSIGQVMRRNVTTSSVYYGQRQPFAGHHGTAVRLLGQTVDGVATGKLKWPLSTCAQSLRQAAADGRISRHYSIVAYDNCGAPSPRR